MASNKLTLLPKAIELQSQGLNNREIGEILGFSPQAIGRWLNPELRNNHRRREQDRYNTAAKQKVLTRNKNRYRQGSTNTITYFASCENYVKIGKTKNIPDRMRKFQTGCPFPVTLLGVCDTPETELQYMFAEFYHQGEWFHLSPEIKEWVNQNTVPFEAYQNEQQLY